MSEIIVKKTMIKVELPEVVLKQPEGSECGLCHQSTRKILGVMDCINHVINVHVPQLFSKLTVEALTQNKDCCIEAVSRGIRDFTIHFTMHHGGKCLVVRIVAKPLR